MNDIIFFENHISHKAKSKLIQAMGSAGLLRQQEMITDLAKLGVQERIAAAKLACAERRKKREKLKQPDLP